MAPYRPPGRSNRSGRSNADNDVFEGLPVKQWGQSFSRVSLAPPVSEVQPGQDDKWADPPMPRDYQMLQPWTQHLLRLARSGRVGTKRKQDSETVDDERPEEENAEEAAKPASDNIDDRGYVAKKWKPVPEHMLVAEHKHFEFLAKRRRGLPNLYSPDQLGAPVPMRKTKVQKTDANGEVTLYEVLVPEGQAVDGEVTDSADLPEAKPVVAPGTVIEGVGIANEEGVLVAEHLKPAAPRRNRPPQKKKGGPGRGKKRVTFTNPDGSTYTTIVPNATKIVPQPGQIVKHVAKGEEASADVTAEEAAAAAAARNDEEGSGSDDGDDDGDEDDDREDGEVSDEDDALGTGAATPAKPHTPAASSTPTLLAETIDAPEPMEDVKSSEPVPVVKEDVPESLPQEEEAVVKAEEPSQPAPVEAEPETREHVSSANMPPMTDTLNASGSITEPAPALPEGEASNQISAELAMEEIKDAPKVEQPAPIEKEEPVPLPEKVEEADEDLLGGLEKYAQPQE